MCSPNKVVDGGGGGVHVYMEVKWVIGDPVTDFQFSKEGVFRVDFRCCRIRVGGGGD